MHTKSFLILLLMMPLTVLENAAIQEFKLDNGLKLIMPEDHRSPADLAIMVFLWLQTAYFHLWYIYQKMIQTSNIKTASSD